MARIALGIEYNGANYHGWQKQGHCKSIQGMLEQALSTVADQSIEVFCAGRTDSKVHATGQVVHFEDPTSLTSNPRELKAWILGGNSRLPKDISINWVQQVPDEFHARFSAVHRRYFYYIYNFPVNRALLTDRALWVRSELDIASMQTACQYLLGEQNFTSLRSSECQSKTPYRNINHANILQHNNFIILDIQANAFLHHMVRNIVGCLLEIGSGNKKSLWLAEVIQAQDRTKAAKTAPPEGLYLVDVGYPENYLSKDSILKPF